jgi:outer membrane protein
MLAAGARADESNGDDVAEASARHEDAVTAAYVDGLIHALEEPRQEAQPIALAGAVATAVANNPGMRANRRVPASAAAGVLDAASVYEPVVTIDGSYDNSKRPNRSTLTGVSGGGSTVDADQYDANFQLSKTFRSGTVADLQWTNNRATTNSSFPAFSPEFTPTVGLTLQQPILKNFLGIQQRTTVLLSRNASRQAAADYESQLSDFVATVVDDYWDVTLAQADLDVAKRALQLATELAKEADARVKIGTLPPVAAKEARADAAAREEEVIAAENDLDLATRTLQYTVMLTGDQGGAPAPLRPAEQHAVLEVPLERGKILRTAIDPRPEVRSARVVVANAELSQRQARNDLLPSLDLVGSYALIGFGGKANPNRSDLTPTGKDEWDAYGDALNALGNNDYYEYRIGIQLEVPLSNASAQARHTQADIELRRSQDSLRQVISGIALEVERAVGDVSSAYKRVSAARLARELAEENLRNQKRRYDVGMVTTTDVLDYQEKLTSAAASEAQAITDHAKAVTELRRAEGTLLDTFGISVRFEDAPELPWWSKF